MDNHVGGVLEKYLTDELSEIESEKVLEHLQTCSTCNELYENKCREALSLGSIHKHAAPDNFSQNVEISIHRRSGGRFFGRRAFGDRVPFELLAVLAIVIGLTIFFYMRSSGTGAMKPQSPPTMLNN